MVTALVPSETACLASSPGRMSRTLEGGVSKCVDVGGAKTYEVWISRDEMVDFLLYAANLEASVATRSKISAKCVRKRKVRKVGVGDAYH